MKTILKNPIIMLIIFSIFIFGIILSQSYGLKEDYLELIFNGFFVLFLFLIICSAIYKFFSSQNIFIKLFQLIPIISLVATFIINFDVLFFPPRCDFPYCSGLDGLMALFLIFAIIVVYVLIDLVIFLVQKYIQRRKNIN